MYFHPANAMKRVGSLVPISAGMPVELQPRHSLMVPRVTAERAWRMTRPQTLAERMDLTTQPVWFKRKSELYTPYWVTPEYRQRFRDNPRSQLSHPRQIYKPYWMENKRGSLIQRPYLGIHPASHVLFHLGTDDLDGLGKGFHPFKAITRAVHFTPSSFKLKNIMGAIGSVTATTATFGLGPLLAPKVFSANSKTMQTVGMATTAIAVVAGAVVLGPALAPGLGSMLSSAATMAGKVVTGMTGFMGAFNRQSPERQQELSNQLSPQQIADIEAGRLSIDQVGTPQVTPAGSSFIPMAPSSSDWSGSRYTPGAGTSEDLGPDGQPGSKRVEASMFGDLSPTMLLVLGVSIVVPILLSRGKK